MKALHTRTGRTGIGLLIGMAAGWLACGGPPAEKPSAAPVAGRKTLPPSLAKTASHGQNASANNAPEATEPFRAPSHREILQCLDECRPYPAIPRSRYDGYLARNRRNAESLIAVYELTDDARLLTEALEKFPDNPVVLMKAATSAEHDKDRAELLKRLSIADPENALARLLQAGDAARTQTPAQLLPQLEHLVGSSRFDHYSRGRFIAMNEAAQSAGLDPLAATIVAGSHSTEPGWSEVLQLNKAFKPFIAQQFADGDAAGAQNTAKVLLALSEKLRLSGLQSVRWESLASELELTVVRAYPPDAAWDAAGKTARETADELAATRKDDPVLAWNRETNHPFGKLAGMPDSTVEAFYNRVLTEGERPAIAWLLQQQAK